MKILAYLFLRRKLSAAVGTLRTAAAVVALTTVAVPVFGQVTLAPTFVYVDSPARYGTVTLTNSNETVQEVFIEFEFGYPAAGADGQRYLEYDDSEAEARFSLSPWVRSFPQRFRIPPKHRRMVRLMISPPDHLEKGVYWTRMIVTSREQSSDGTAENRAQVNFEFKQVIPIVFDRDAGSTAADVTNLFVDVEPDEVRFVATVERTGAVPYFGTIDLRLVDDRGREAARVETTTDVYFDSSTYFTVNRDDLPAGPYVAEVSLRSERSDVRKGTVPEMEPATRRFRVTIGEPMGLSYEPQ